MHYDSLLSTQLLELFIQLVALNKGGIMKGYLFGLGAMLVGAGLMFVLMHGEVRADDYNEIKCEINNCTLELYI